MASDNKKVRTRFAPSPTGYLHVGGLRTALYSFLLAKKHGGEFLLRIEDTDQERFVEGGIENILNSLFWAGVVPDEGVVLEFEDAKDGKPHPTHAYRQAGSPWKGEGAKVTQKGKKGPYIQSERLELYKKYADELIEKGAAYYCFCTSERLDQLREYQTNNKMPTGYDRQCLKLSKEEVETNLKNGTSKVVRMKMPKEGETVFNDMIRGEVKFKNALIDDQILIKSDGFPTYHLAVVVDDHLMEITHVTRAEEWISSTPKHIQLYEYFGWKAPEFAHLPLLLNPDKSKLSKRQGDVAVSDYTAKGYLPEALVNFVAFLGWNPGTERELYNMEDLVKDFDLSKVNKTGAVFNIDKLNWFNKEYLKRLSDKQLVELASPWLVSSGIVEESRIKNQESWIASVLNLERERVTTLAELPEAIKFVFELPVYDKEVLVWRKGTIDEVKKVLPEVKAFLETIDEKDWNRAKLGEKIGEWITAQGYSTGSVLWPLRVSLSGQQNSPGPYEIAEVLGKEETLRRIDSAIAKL